MRITRAVKIYYRVSDGLLAMKVPAGQHLSWIPIRLWLSFKGHLSKQSGLIVNVSHIKREVTHSLSQQEIFCDSVPAVLKWFCDTFKNCFDTCSLAKVALELDDLIYSIDTEIDNMLIFTRKYEMASSHRLWNDKWSEEKNYQEFGKCANPNGHGHNYLLEVSVASTTGPETQEYIDPDAIDAIVNEFIVEKFDHKNLCIDIPEMQGMVPTVEMMSMVVWDILKDKFSNLSLHNIRIWETQNTYADYNGSL